MDRNNQFTIKKTYGFFLLILLLSCKLETSKHRIELEIPKYGIEFNVEREKIGLPILDSNWRDLDRGKTYDDKTSSIVSYGRWTNPVAARPNYNKPFYISKSITYNSDTIIIRESDKYLGSRRYTTIDGTSTEMLTITYFFADSLWRYDLRGERILDQGYSLTDVFALTKEEADSVLKHWNIDR